MQRWSRKGNGGMHECTYLLENLSLIKICSRDPGPHMLAKQTLVCTDGELSPSGILCNGGSDKFSVARVCFFSFGSLLTVFKTFMPLGNFFY